MSRKIQFGVELESMGLNGQQVNEALLAADASGNGLEGMWGWQQGPTFDSANGGGWKIEEDGSLTDSIPRATMTRRGTHEIIAPILHGIEAGEREVSRLCTQLTRRGATVDSSCGTHITFGLTNMSRFARMSSAKKYRMADRIVRIYDHYQEIWDALSPNCRTTWSNSNGCIGRVSLGNPFGSRYTNVNLSHFILHGRVEFRQPGFTLDGKKIGGWLRLCYGVIKAAMNNNHPSFDIDLSERDGDSLEDFLDFLRVGRKTEQWAVTRVLYLRDRYTGNRDRRTAVLGRMG